MASGKRAPVARDSRSLGLLLLILLSAPLYLLALGRPPLWQDESTTALLGRHVLATGLQTVGRGPDSASQDLDQKRAWGDVDVTVPVAEAYLAAAGIAASGVRGPAQNMGEVRRLSAWARLPFVVCALLTVLVLYGTVHRALTEGSSPDDAWARRVALTAAALTLGSSLFVLGARQCRYYATAALTVMLVVWAYDRLRREGRWRVTALAASAVALVLTNDVVWLGVCSVLVLHWAALERERIPAGLLLRGLVPSMAVAAAWLALCATATRYQRVDFAGIPYVLRAYFLETNAHVFPALLVPAGLALWGRGVLRGSPGTLVRRAWEAAHEPGHPLRLGVLLLLVGAAVAMVHAPLRNVYPRYLVPAVPPCAAVAALLLVPRSSSRRVALLSLALVVLFASTDAAGFLSDAPLRIGDFRPARKHRDWARPHFTPELLGLFVDPPPGPVSGVLETLFREGTPGENMVAAYGDQPLKVFTFLSVYGGFTGDYPDPETVVWAWPRASTSIDRDSKNGYPGWWIENRLDASRFERIVVPVPDRRWEFRPDPDYVWTMAAADVPRVVLYRRRDR